LPEQINQKLTQKWKKLSAEGYIPRTKHVENSKPLFFNRLFLETSPYLLQHAHNPVNWFPWGEEAFEEAKKTDKPVFLSVGYATCHWCHVMEEESFEDLEIAKYMNEHFVCVKVDREERPDVDSVYMSVVQAMSGRGGWPMSVWMTHEQKPFYGGTYFPARDGDRGSNFGFLSLLKRLDQAYKGEREKVFLSSEKTTEHLNAVMNQSLLSEDVKVKASFDAAVFHYKENYDATFGGVGDAPKFPSSLPVGFLLKESQSDAGVLDMLKNTLSKMALGGMYDQVGGGFHRYSTDEKWLIPHFEKMLYDNALLAKHYTQAFRVTKDEFYKFIACDTLDYLLREMRSPQGAFFSATDADSKNQEGESVEGYYFSWSHQELESLFTPDERDELSKVFKLSKDGNFEGRNVLERVSKTSFIGTPLRAKMLQLRQKRPDPLCDTKILLSWNALVLSALSLASQVFARADYLKAATEAVDFILENMKKAEQLFHVYAEGEAKQEAFLEDYAFFTAALLDLFESTGEARFFEEALLLDRHLEANFEDSKGGYFKSSRLQKALIANERPYYDGAEPSGNSIMAQNLERLYLFTLEESYRARADRLYKSFALRLNEFPWVMPEMLSALQIKEGDPFQLVAISTKASEVSSFRKAYFNNFSKSGIFIETQENGPLHSRFSYLKDKVAVDSKATAYLCFLGACQKPVTSAEELQL